MEKDGPLGGKKNITKKIKSAKRGKSHQKGGQGIVT